ncbi:undecaprenyl-phospho-4-deoxy-4-formamido-alpha-L-arabinopyranose deformylase, putative [Geotalea daltonii FRC-32]|uniref:Undecaprenyl-phospho-4-deoxy-4-formamido-alpha-L-arabinopyranose deformylase, putative n=1 Tax=Geotalea daltonii (strain DSM 22248 / JCM 15807 / FRC-32) TaxID=316067 RepID=B9M5F0_GEODF|nr:4-deoxy-4-formamido-L-arabinose-phosphoundecaprenol deformylase [Geotalea daltonii]ACM19905.1 undecaprenyl-phospho-4-deoxy-4-formamido-alpha-L-arabinopyranose deformylase, putative [Geotalea daltonii FRC-32]
MSQSTIALKVDVDTYIGTRDGVPRLLEIMESAEIKATFYFSMGPDNSGKAIRRIFTRKGFLKKMLRTGAPSAYGIKTMLYGTLLPPPMIGSAFPDILRKTAAMGHETGIHCWDHVKWHDLLPWMPKKTVAMEMGRAFALYEQIMGRRPRTTAAPGWTVSEDSLEIQDALHLSYCSDSRGTSPFYPVLDNRRFATLQIPTTWPTMDELIGENGITADNINDHYLACLRPGLNVHTIHAELEGRVLAAQFTDLLQRLKDRGARFITLAEAAVEHGANAAESSMAMGELAGRAGAVALQL